MVEEGEQAPDFKLKGVDDKEHSLKEFKGKKVILYFYPKDDTPGCTIEAKDFTTNAKEVEKLGAVVLGVSADSYESHCSFRDKHGLKVLLLSDPGNSVSKKYEAYGNKGIFGEGIIRTTYLIDENGKIEKVWKRVQAVGHAKAVLEYIKG